MSGGQDLARSSSVGLYWPELGDLGESWSTYQKNVKKEKEHLVNSYLSKSADGARGVRRMKSISIDFGAAAKQLKGSNSYDFGQIQRILQAYDMPQLPPFQDVDSGELTPIVEAALFQTSENCQQQQSKTRMMMRSQSMRSTQIPFVHVEDKCGGGGDSRKEQIASAPQTTNLLIKASKGRSLSRFMSELAPRQHDKDWSKQVEHSLGIDFKKDILGKNNNSKQ